MAQTTYLRDVTIILNNSHIIIMYWEELKEKYLMGWRGWPII